MLNDMTPTAADFAYAAAQDAKQKAQTEAQQLRDVIALLEQRARVLEAAVERLSRGEGFAQSAQTMRRDSRSEEAQ